MTQKSLEQIQRPENKIIHTLDENTQTNLQERMETMFSLATSQFEEFKAQGGKKLWQMRNQDTVDYIKEARDLLRRYGSNQVIQQLLENNELEIQSPDDARLLAFCRLVEISQGSKN